VHKLLATIALALLFVGSARAQDANLVRVGDGEIQTYLDWQQLIDRANAHRVEMNARRAAKQTVAEPTVSSDNQREATKPTER
jgi:hypothetical protein